ncbi:MAG: ATP-grasp domain-containing protein [Simkaniaceae bacterium]|nr:MAG: ATP-grasp domain-containing protein [Simkaniaceae bacterium]
MVFAAETSSHHVCRYSNAFKKHFVVPSPRFKSEGFINALVDICRKEEIDLVIPTFEEIFCLAKGLDRFPKKTKVLCSSYEVLDELHNKWRFNKKIETLGFDTPKSYLVHSQEELNNLPLKVPYILKPSYSRAALCIQKVNSKPPPQVKIDPRNPLVAQEWLHGKKFCSYSIAHNGKLSAHTLYPVDFSIEGNACLNFEAINHPKIQSWIKSFVEKENFSGQIAFDFIETSEDKLYAIECNPRGTSGINLFQEKDNFPAAFFDVQEKLVTPELGYSKKLAWGMILYGWKTGQLLKFAKKFIMVEDVIFSKKDLKPFFHQPLLFFVYLFRSFKLRSRLPAMFTFDIDWNGQEATDLEQTPCKESS